MGGSAVLSDATGAALAIGDRVGTVTGRQNPVVLVCEVKRIGASMLTGKVISSRYTGDPISGYARRPHPGDEVRIHAWRAFKLGPCPCECREAELERAWNGD